LEGATVSLTIKDWETYHCVNCIVLCEENQRLRDALAPFASLVLITEPDMDPRTPLIYGRVNPDDDFPTLTFGDVQKAAKVIGLRDNTGGDDVRADGS
jgi:hypothetical protein